MGRSDGTPSYQAYLQQLGDEVSDLDPAIRQEVVREVSAHLEDADEALSDGIPDPAIRAQQVLSQYGDARALARQLGAVHAGPTGRIQRFLAPCLLAALAAGHLATALALNSAYTKEATSQSGTLPLGYTHVYLIMAALAFALALRQLVGVLRHPFRATDFQLFLPVFPLALLLAMWLAGLSLEGRQPVAYRLEQFWYAGFDPDLYASSLVTGRVSQPNADPKFFDFGLALAALSLLGILPALLLRQPRWLLLWAGIHGTLLTIGLWIPFVLGAMWVRPQSAGFFPILVLPWLYAAAAWLLGLPLHRLGGKPLVIWVVGALAGAGLLLQGYLFPRSSMAGLLLFAWYWPPAITLFICARRLWPYAVPERRVSDPLAALLLVPATLILSLMLVQTDWATPEVWKSEIAIWENGELLWGAAQWLFVAALAAWTLLLAAVVAGRVAGLRTRLRRS